MAGTTGAQFLSQGGGARAMAMGEAFCAVADDASALFWNPAGLTRLNSPQLLATHSFGLENTYQDFIDWAQPWQPVTLAAGLHYASMPGLEALDELGRTQGSFQPYDLAFTAGCGLALPLFEAGASITFFREDLGQAASTGYAVDLGGWLPLRDDLALGFKFENIGPGIRFVDQSQPLPFAMRAGVNYHPFPGWNATTDLVLPLDNTPQVHLGLEYQWPLGSSLVLSPRLGFKTTTVQDNGFLSSLACGMGIRLAGWTLDYAWLPQGELGASHYLTLSLDLGKEPSANLSAALPPDIPETAEPEEAEGNSLEAVAAEPEKADRSQPASPQPQRPAKRKLLSRHSHEREASPAPKNLPPETLKQWTEYYYTRALTYYGQKKYYTAKTYCVQALKWTPGHAGLTRLLVDVQNELAVSQVAPSATPAMTPGGQP
jgi:hypothetical protein